MLSYLFCKGIEYYNPAQARKKQKIVRLLLEVYTGAVTGSKAKTFCCLAAVSYSH